MTNFKMKPADYLVITLVACFGLAGFWFNLQQGRGVERKYAVIYVENIRIGEISLASGDSFRYTFEFGGNSPVQATLEVSEGRVRMLPLGEDLCPRGICAHTGWIAYSYESIVCLPNRIMIIFSDSPASDTDLDGVTH
ncbi:MAG TPA: NusG domain II-containing protein [Candidatus Limnocylindrales bacterium]|nr:NusG domain II-containing protein [Candidatus Limnocylindrales bacterium]